MRKLQVDQEFSSLLPPLSEKEFNDLEKSLVEHGYEGPAIQLWNGVIVDGHNRYYLCRKHNIEFKTENIEFENREEAMQWMIRLQIAKRNLTVAERIRLAEKSRPAIEKAARERQLSTLKKGDNPVPQNFGEREISKDKKNETDSKLAEIAGVNRETYRQGKRVLDSGNKEIIDRMAKGELSVNAAYKAIVGKDMCTEASKNTGVTKEQVYKEKTTSPESQIEGKNDGRGAYEICIEAKTKRPTTSSGVRDIICRKLMDTVDDLESFVGVGLFDLCDFDGYETEESFASVGEPEDVKAVVENLNEIIKISNEYIEKLKERRDI